MCISATKHSSLLPKPIETGSYKNRILIEPALTALIISAFMACEVAIILLIIASALPYGTMRLIGFGLTSLSTIYFIVWFGIHVYKAELKLISGANPETYIETDIKE